MTGFQPGFGQFPKFLSGLFYGERRQILPRLLARRHAIPVSDPLAVRFVQAAWHDTQRLELLDAPNIFEGIAVVQNNYLAGAAQPPAKSFPGGIEPGGPGREVRAATPNSREVPQPFSVEKTV